MSWLIALWSINAAAGITLSVLLISLRHRFSLQRWLRSGTNGHAPVSPSVSVVIAARNEEQAVERTLREFAALPGVAEVILVDDGSEDNTLQIARSVEAECFGVRVLEAPPLPRGWVGKTHAIHWGSQFATAGFILFTDADVRIENLPLQDIVSRMDEDSLDHVGGSFRFEVRSWSEALVVPVFSAVAFVALGLAALRRGAGSGAFNLVRKSAYNRLNGHSTIRSQVVDDVALALQFTGDGLHSRFVDTSSAISVRLIEGLHGLFRSLSRWSVLLSRTPACLVLACSLVAIALNLSLVAGPTALWAEQGASDFWRALGVSLPLVFIATYLLSVLPFVLAGSLHSGHRCWGFAAPAGQVLMATAVAAAAWRALMGHEVQWRGRTYAH